MKPEGIEKGWAIVVVPIDNIHTYVVLVFNSKKHFAISILLCVKREILKFKYTSNIHTNLCYSLCVSIYLKVLYKIEIGNTFVATNEMFLQ